MRIDESGNIERLNETPEVIATVMTQWHLIGVISYILNKYGSLDDVRVMVIVLKHPISGYLIDTSVLEGYGNVIVVKRDDFINGKRFYAKLILVLINLFIKSETSIDYISPRKVALINLLNTLGCISILSHKINYICVDEGLGTYLSKQVWERCSIAEGGYGIKAKIKDSLNIFFGKAAGALSWNMMYFDGKLRVNHRVVSYYKEAIKIIYGQQSNDIELRKIKDNGTPVAIILSQPWSEQGQQHIEEEMEILGKICDSLVRKGYSVAIKPHPRERANKYLKFKDFVLLLTSNLPAELFFMNLSQDDLVVGYNSTALLTAAVIYKIPSFTMLNMLSLDSVENMMSVSIKEFKYLTGEIIPDFRPEI